MSTATKRIVTGLIMAIVLIPILVIGSWPLTILMMLLAYSAGYELTVLFLKEEPALMKLKYLIPLFLSMFVLLNANYHQYLILYLIFLTVIVLMTSLISQEGLKVTMSLTFMIVYIGLGFYASSQLINATKKDFNVNFSHLGFFLMMYLISAIMFTDIGAYAFGRRFGKKPLSPIISPKKTVEGAIGGTITGIFFSTIYYFVFYKITNYHLFTFLNGTHLFTQIIFLVCLSLLLSVVGQIGDLIASKIKRTFQIKDFGFIFPGHGGVLDRFDSMLLGMMVFYVIWTLIEALS